MIDKYPSARAIKTLIGSVLLITLYVYAFVGCAPFSKPTILRASVLTEAGERLWTFKLSDGKVLTDEASLGKMLGYQVAFEIPVSPPWGFSVSKGYVIDAQTDKLRVDVKAAWGEVGPLGVDVGLHNGFVVVDGKGILISPSNSADDYSSLYEVNLQTGAATELLILDKPGIVTGVEVLQE